MKMVAILAMVGMIALIVCVLLAFAFFIVGVIDEMFERAESVNSDSQLYKQVGNACTVNVVYEIAKRL